LPGSPEGRWQLIVKHRSGSLEVVVAAGRRRNLGISFGILLLLAVSAVMVFISTMRARRLAELQMEFVAGVSHELRTPLAVICSAADNLADGIVEAKDQVQHYGALIRSEGSRLSRMVQQILLFASGQTGRAHYELHPVQVGEIIDRVLADAAHMVETASFSVERQIEPDLPLVMADANALGHCLQNLVSNAVKYGGDRRWIGIRARKMDGARGPEVQVMVEDKGPGIEPAELSDIFRPFYGCPDSRDRVGFEPGKIHRRSDGRKAERRKRAGKGQCFHATSARGEAGRTTAQREGWMNLVPRNLGPATGCSDDGRTNSARGR
jgi:signal transduction histidine kinase